MNKTNLLSSNQLLDIFSSSHIATAIYTTDNLIIEAVTDAMLVSWGKTRDIIGVPLLQAVPELEGQPFIEQMKKALKTGDFFSATGAEAKLFVDGVLTPHFYDYEYRPIKNNKGEVYCLLHNLQDVTERVLGEKAIAIEQEHLIKLSHELSLNEELAAANEELAAINEELTQTRDQLNDLNHELEERVTLRTAALEASQSRIRYMIDDAPVAIALLVGRDFVIESSNQKMLAIWGKSASVIGKTLIHAIPELKGQPFIPLLENVFDTGEAFTGNEIRGMMEYNGELKEVFTNFVYKPLKDEKGEIYSIMVVANEVTEQVIARKAIEAARFRLEAMVATTPIAMTILHSRDLIIEQANAAMYQIWKRNAQQTLGKKLTDVFPELIGQPFPDLLAKVFDTGESIAFDELPVTIAFPDGSSKDIFVKFSYNPIFDQEHRVESILASVIDITESVLSRKELEKSEELLQQSSEELAAANEELMAINEEMMASNEELIDTQSHLHDTIDQLNESRERFRFLLNSIPQQVWTANPEGVIDYVNNVVCADFGYDIDVVLAREWTSFIHPDDLTEAMEKWQQALFTGSQYQVEFRLLFADGSYHWHMARAVPLLENGKIQMWVGTNTNIALQKANEEKKDEFLSIASHELRTPLTSIKAFNQLIKRGGDPQKLESFIQRSSGHIQRLEKLIADLLDVTKMNSGKLEYNMHPFSFNQLLHDSVDNARQISPTHEIILENSVDILFNGDHFRLEQVLNNFLSNAIKYSPEGNKVIVDSKLADENIVVSVQDFGIGIAPAHIDKLFDRYYRVDNTSMRFEGLGLGLFISSEILKRHHGKIWIESQLGQGSTFYFSLPVSQANLN